jgi:DNA (cytosine-5)-methyltransferase 1
MARYLSVCAGIEAATCAWHPLGWQPVAFSEVDRFPSAVLAHHYPDTPNVGDMTKIATGETDVGPFDLLVGGTPCQSFSVAGLRKGLADPRGNLAIAYLEIARRYRPQWLVWENVPGVLSSNGGRDFGSILGGMGELGYGFAYRVLDAQYFGVAQRRRRVFVVGCLGDWRRAAAVLFERHSLQGHPAPSREAGEGAAAGAIKGAAIGREPENGPQYGEWLTDGSCYTLNCTEQHAVAQCVTTGTGQRYDAESETLVAFNHQTGGDFRPMVQANQANALQANQGQAVAFTQNQNGDVLTGAISPSMGTNQNATGRNTPKVKEGAAVRRLTPREAERLQGFPDDYTAIFYRNGTAADGPRYKALGNSMAVPVVRWIGERIEAVRAIQADTEAA